MEQNVIDRFIYQINMKCPSNRKSRQVEQNMCENSSPNNIENNEEVQKEIVGVFCGCR